MRPARFIPPGKTVSQWRAGLAIDCSKPRSRYGRICRREVASRNPKRPGRCMRSQRFAQGQHKRHACPARMPRYGSATCAGCPGSRPVFQLLATQAGTQIFCRATTSLSAGYSDAHLAAAKHGTASRAEAFVKRNPRCYSGHKPSEVRHAYPQTEFGFRLLRSRNCSMGLHAGCGTRGNRDEARSRRFRNA